MSLVRAPVLHQDLDLMHVEMLTMEHDIKLLDIALPVSADHVDPMNIVTRVAHRST